MRSTVSDRMFMVASLTVRAVTCGVRGQASGEPWRNPRGAYPFVFFFASSNSLRNFCLDASQQVLPLFLWVFVEVTIKFQDRVPLSRVTRRASADTLVVSGAPPGVARLRR